MKYFAFVLLISGALAFPLESGPGVIPILQKDNVRDDFGQYASQYVSGDGTSVQEKGQLKPGPEGNVIVKEGSFSYTSPEGSSFSLSYTADENGFQPKAAHLPQPPAVL